MKKRFFMILFLSFILCTTVFASCKTSDKQTHIDSISEGNSVSKLLDSAVPANSEGTLSYIPNNAIEEELMQELLPFQQDKLLSICFIYNEETNADQLQLRLFSLDSGKVLSECLLPSTNAYAPTVQVCQEQIVVSNGTAGCIQVFDQQLKEVRTYSVSGDSIYVDPEISTAYVLSYNDGLFSVDLNTGSQTSILKNISDLTLYSKVGNNLSLRYIDCTTFDKKECFAGLDLTTGKIEYFEIDDCFAGLAYASGRWVGEMQSKKNQFFLGTTIAPYVFQLEGSYPSVTFTENPEHLILTQTDEDGNQLLSAYNIDGTFLSTCSLKQVGSTSSNNMVWLAKDNGYLFTAIDETGHDKLYFWDLNASTTGTDVVLETYSKNEIPLGTAVPTDYYEKAKKLSKKYDISIKIADQCNTTYSDKLALQECDPDKIEASLQILDTALSNYPTGFWKQLRYGSFRTLEINLMGEISNTEYIEGYSPTAFVQQENGVITVVLNITVDADVLEQNIYHESSHIIDKVLEHNALYRNDALYSEEIWFTHNPESFISLNPENGGYFCSYNMMPMEYYQEDFTSYFVDDYGKSFSTEDRATIFETAMKGFDQIFHVSPELHTKLEYYCKCIRDCFDTSNWPDAVQWENALN